MSSRRASTLSTRSVKQRKYSTDRHQRQAGLSIAIEEGRSLRPPLVKENEVSQSFLQDVFSKPQATTLTRADTFPCPLEIHPGRRVRGFSTAVADLPEEEEALEFKNPFPEPSDTQQTDIQQRGAVFRRVNTDINAEEAQLRVTRSASKARNRANRPLDRFKKLLGIKPTITPGAFSGLEYVASLATTHATSILSQKQAPVFKRRSLYVLEYDIDDQGVLLCAPPKLCGNVASLRRYLEEEDHPASLLRLIYVCNFEEAINYLSNAFGVSGSSADTGERSFREWMQDDRDIRRASHKAIRWRPAFDLARGVICTAFGLDFASLVSMPEKAAAPKPRVQISTASYRQRISVYIQRASSEALPGPRVTRFNSGSNHLHDMAKRDTVIICEYSSGETGEIVSANALLGLNPGFVARRPVSDIEKYSSASDRASNASTPTLQAVLSHVFDGMYQLWRDQIALIHEPHASLEDHIYAHPSDSSRARDVWAMSQRLHNMLKLINRHSKVIEAVHDDFGIFTEVEVDEDDTKTSRTDWLTPLLDDFEVLAENVVTDYLQPLENMIDLMYKSVTIADSKHSLELNASLWRLSWITFIFLPLTFLVGAFGMNVDSFRDYPSLKWYFVAVIPLMVVVLLFWFSMRRFAPGRDKSDLMDVAVMRAGLRARSL